VRPLRFLRRAATPLPQTSKPFSVRTAALKAGWRSGLEEQIAKEFAAQGCEVRYEEFFIPWMPEPKLSKYTPDFFLISNGIVVETKGRWVTADRKKIKTVIKQHPDLDLRLVFSNAHARISKQSKTTYAAYCETLGLPWAHRHVPVSWMTEAVNKKSLAAVKRLMEEQKK
jgi:hypothetical protein